MNMNYSVQTYVWGGAFRNNNLIIPSFIYNKIIKLT